MNRKIRLLIIASVLGLIALSIIQGYLINNTYQLKKDVFLQETRKEIGRLDDYSPVVDSINDLWKDYFIDLLIEYQKEKRNSIVEENNELIIAKNNVISRLKLKTDSLNSEFLRVYNKELEKKDLKFKIKFQKRVQVIILKDSLSVDTLFFSNKKTPKFHLIGNHFPEKTGHKVSSSLWMTDHDYKYVTNNKVIENLSFDLEFLTIDSMNIDGWEKIVLKRMLGIFSIAILLFLFVFGLLYYSIKNLIKQKKIADVKTDFVNNITHELKTPLATLTLATKMLSVDSVKKNEQVLDQTVQTIERQNKRLQKLIDQVLDNSLGYKEIKLKKEEVNINNYLNTVIDDFLLSVNHKKVEIKRNFSTSLEMTKQILNIDKFYFTTAILNILENAVKYNGDEIKIEINSQINNTFILSIKDNGIGISKKNQKDLFEKFYRVDNRNVHNVKGLGLGLYYTNQIIKAHSGEIKVISEERKGTEFVVEIPISNSSQREEN